MNLLKRLILGSLYAAPCAAAVWFIVGRFMTDPNMLLVIKYSGYVTMGICFVALFFTILLALFSLSLMSIRHLFNLKRSDNIAPRSVAPEKVDDTKTKQ